MDQQRGEAGLETMTPWAALSADTHRQYGHFSVGALVCGLVARRTFRVIALLRICQGLRDASWILRTLLPLFQVLYRISASHAAMDLPWRTQIGGGLAITHGWGLVVNPGVRIGSNVTLFHGVTLGRRDRLARDGVRLTGYPTIEDEVWIGPHAIVVGDVTIGRGSRIAGGAFITENVPPYSVVAGNPSKVVKSGCTPDVMNPAPL